jgi:hypothetical protein
VSRIYERGREEEKITDTSAVKSLPPIAQSSAQHSGLFAGYDILLFKSLTQKYTIDAASASKWELSMNRNGVSLCEQMS